MAVESYHERTSKRDLLINFDIYLKTPGIRVVEEFEDPRQLCLDH
jgi:hypothetical protein